MTRTKDLQNVVTQSLFYFLFAVLGQPFDILPTIKASVSNVLCYVFFGNRFSYEDKNLIELLEIFKAFNSFFVSTPGVVC